jgi:hypothetical protein
MTSPIIAAVSFEFCYFSPGRTSQTTYIILTSFRLKYKYLTLIYPKLAPYLPQAAIGPFDQSERSLRYGMKKSNIQDGGYISYFL